MFGTKRRTKMGRTPLSRFREEFAQVRTPALLANHGRGYKSARAKEILGIIRTSKPRKIAGFTVYFADFKHPKLQKDRGFIAGKIVLLDRKTHAGMPHKLLEFILRHEYREELLMIAGYSIRPRKGGTTVHRIALKKELIDLQRAGLLKQYLQMLKARMPRAFKERIGKWGIDPKTLEPKAGA